MSRKESSILEKSEIQIVENHRASSSNEAGYRGVAETP